MRFSPIAGLGYVVAQTNKQDEWCRFATDVLGMMPSKLDLPDGGHAFRMDDRMARIILQPGEDRVVAVGWEVAGEPEWEDMLVRLDKEGLSGEEVTGKEANERGVMALRRLKDPSDLTVEICLRPLCDSIDRFVSPIGVRFVTGDQGMGHITCAAANYKETVEFYTHVLGFRVHDTIDFGHRVTFASPNPRQHSIGIADGAGSNHFHHVMVEVDSIDDVGRCLDRVETGAARQTMTLGRHYNDHMISFYMESPSGFQIEYGFAGRRVDLDEWVENTQGGVGGPSFWGHHPIPAPAQAS